MLFKNSYQKGFTLVELLVGLAIGLLVGIVSLNYLATSTRLLTNQNAADLIQENARFAFDFLSSEVRLAGLNETSTLGRDGAGLVEGITSKSICTAGPTDTPTNADTGDCNVNGETYQLGGTGPGINSDRIAIDYVTQDGTTCSGVAITEELSVITVYWVADIDGDSIPSLYCQSYTSFFSPDPDTPGYFDYRVSGGVTPLVDGVESLQVLYGVDTANVAGSNIEDIEYYDTYEAIDNANLTDNIRSVKIGLLVNSGQVIQGTTRTERAGIARTYSILGQDFDVPATDGIERKSLATTIHFPNLSSPTL